jgi:hypothetical protein
MKLMERIYTGVILVCLLCCAALTARMVGGTRRQKAETPVHTPPVQLEQQMPEPVPETDPTAEHTGPVMLDEGALTAQLAKLLPEGLHIRDLALTVRKNGQIGFRGTADRDGLLEWLESKGAQLGGSMSPLRVLLPESIDFTLTLQASQAAGTGEITLVPVSAALGGVDVTLPELPPEARAALDDAVNRTLAANGWTGALEFLEGGILLG